MIAAGYESHLRAGAIIINVNRKQVGHLENFWFPAHSHVQRYRVDGLGTRGFRTYHVLMEYVLGYDRGKLLESLMAKSVARPYY